MNLAPIGKWLAVALLLASPQALAAGDLTLWYDKPATRWEQEALPIGNGRLGAMVFGGVEKERLQFNEESLWIGDENDTAGCCLDPHCIAAYKDFLRQQYKTIDALNASWGETYASFDDVQLYPDDEFNRGEAFKKGIYPRWFDRQLFARQPLQFARGQILFAKLNVIHPGRRRFRNLVQQAPALLRFSAGKLATVADVVEEHRSTEYPSAEYKGRGVFNSVLSTWYSVPPAAATPRRPKHIETP
jgi:hypothetical protein